MQLASQAARDNAPSVCGGGGDAGGSLFEPSKSPIQISTSSPATASADQEFHPFPRLPLELRLKIWRHTFQTRILTVAQSEVGGGKCRECEAEWYDEKTCDIHCKSTCPPPLVLHVCQESRKEALRAYQLSFGTGENPATIYFNPSLDIVYFPLDFSELVDSRVDSKSLARIRSICFANYGFSYCVDMSDLKEHLELERFSSVEQLYLLVWDNDMCTKTSSRWPGPAPIVLEDVEWLVCKTSLQEDSKPRPK